MNDKPVIRYKLVLILNVNVCFCEILMSILNHVETSGLQTLGSQVISLLPGGLYISILSESI